MANDQIFFICETMCTVVTWIGTIILFWITNLHIDEMIPSKNTLLQEASWLIENKKTGDYDQWPNDEWLSRYEAWKKKVGK